MERVVSADPGPHGSVVRETTPGTLERGRGVKFRDLPTSPRLQVLPRNTESGVFRC